jgi:integrase
MATSRRGQRAGTGSVRPRQLANGSSKFEAYGRGPKGKVYLGSFDTQREADQVLEDHRVLQRQIERGEAPPEIDRRRTFREAAELWLRGRDRSRSVATYRGQLDRHIFGALGDVPLTSITIETLEALQDRLLNEPTAQGEMLGQRTVRHLMQTTGGVLRFAWKRKFIAHNPAAGLELIQFPDRAYNWIRTRAEQERLLLAARDPIRSMLAVYMLTGLRRDELVFLRWDDVDLEHRIITVQRGRKGPTKGGKFRYVPVNDALLPVLRRWRLLSGDIAGLVFPGRHGRARAASAVTQMFKLTLKRAALDQSLRLHDLRHTYASHFIRDGGDIFRLSKYLGHTSVVVTERYYAHLVPDDYAQDWGRNAIRVPFDDVVATVVPLAAAGEARENAIDDLGHAGESPSTWPESGWNRTPAADAAQNGQRFHM